VRHAYIIIFLHEKDKKKKDEFDVKVLFLLMIRRACDNQIYL